MKMSSVKTKSENPLIVDFSAAENVSSTKEPKYRAMAERLVDVLKTYGYAYVKTGAIDQKQIDELMCSADRFFQLPYDVKLKYEMNAANFKGKNGYMGFDFERLDQKYEGAVEWRESFNLKDLENPLGLDDQCPGFQNIFYTFFRQCKELLLVIYRAMAVGLNLEDEHIFEQMHQCIGTSDSLALMRVINYPPMSSELGAPVLRCGAHADYDFLTLNFQDDVGGLQMLDRKTGDYVAVPSIPGTVLIQTGLVLEKMTDGLFTGTFHRVIEVGASENYKRRSIAFFGVPDISVRMKNLFRYHVIEEGDDVILTAKEYVHQLLKASFDKSEILKRASENYAL